MEVTPSGIVTEVKLEQYSNAEEWMKRTVFGMTNSPVIDVGTSIKTTFAALSYCTPFASFQRFEQPENAYSPMEVTLEGIVTKVKLEQLRNA